jgi:hypothetical protein
MNRLSSPPSAWAPRRLELRSLATIAVALAACPHPEGARLSANVIVIAQAARITGCSLCGATAADEGSGDVWQRLAFASRLSSSCLAELSLVLHTLRRWHAAVVHGSDMPCAASPLRVLLEQDLRATLRAFASIALYRDLDRLDRSIATAEPVR